MNQNDPTAKVYDIVYQNYKSEKLLLDEIKIINNLIPEGTNILDIGCGTGRHAIGLAEQGYLVDGVDTSKEMLAVLKQKIIDTELRSRINLFNNDFKELRLRNRYDLIILMWNALFEIAFTKDELIITFQKIKEVLVESGRVLINIDVFDCIDVENLEFEITEEVEGFEYKLLWKTIEFNKQDRITYSLEKIIESSIKDSRYRVFEAKIRQKWWKLDEVKYYAERFQMKLSVLKNIFSEELYIVLEN